MTQSDTYTVTLRKAVQVGDVSYDALRVREPSAGELLEINRYTGTSADIVAVSRVAGVPVAAVKLMASSALVKAADWIAAALKAATDSFYPDGGFPDDLDMPLRKAVEHDGKTWSSLPLREPTAGELEAFNKFEGTERDIMAVVTVSGAPRPLVEKLLAGDLLRGMKFINSFIQGGPPAGAG